MARLEIPSIVVHKGGRSDSRPGSPCSVECEGGMPSLPASSPQSPGNASSPTLDMIESNVNGQIHQSVSTGTSDTEITESRNYRNRANCKVKLLVRSHAMRESTSPPRGDSPQDIKTSPSQSIDVEPNSPGKKYANGNSLSPSDNGGSKQLNNNESIQNCNIPDGSHSPKETRNWATSPTRRTPQNGSSSPVPIPSKTPSPQANVTSKSEEGKRGRSTNSSNSKCSNCVKGVQGERPVLLQTPLSPTKNQQKNAQNNQYGKSDQRRSNNNNFQSCTNQCSGQCSNTLSVSRSNSRHKLRHQNSSSQGSYESSSPSLSRDNSTEMYTDSTGIDLEQFIAETINRNQKDRTVLLKIEKDLTEFARDKQRVSHKFPNMSSYNRMLVHRVAAYFGMEHNVDQSGLSVIITRTKNMRIPDTRFKEHIRDDLILPEEPRRSILKRDSSSFEDSYNYKSPDRMSGDYCRRSKSFEEREEEYEKARRRIFENSSGDSGDMASWPYWSSSESSDASARYRLLPPDHCMRQGRLSKGDSLDGRESYRSNGSRPSVSKSNSFGGYTRGQLSRGDSVNSTHSASARLTKQDSSTSMCSRLSPSSSGYKSQSQRSDTTISPSLSPSPIPNMTCNHPQISSHDAASPDPSGQTVMWAVTSISSVPAGSVIIDPQTNQPYTNPDGTIYRFDPENPPKFFIEDTDSGEQAQSTKQNEHSDTQQSRPNGKGEPNKRRSQTTKGNNNHTGNNCSTTSATTTVTTSASSTQVTNTATSPSLPFTPPPPPPPPPPPLPPSNLVQHQQHQNPLPQQPLVRTVAVHPCNHSQPSTQYATYVPSSETYSQGVYQQPIAAQQTVMMASHGMQGQPPLLHNGQEDPNFNQNPIYTNYSVPVQQPQITQTGQEISELPSYFVGMNVYDQRATNDAPIANHPYPPHPPSTNIPSVQSMPPNCWQSSQAQMPAQQAMYFVQPPGSSVPCSQPGDRQQCPQQRFGHSYSISMQTMAPTTQTSANYMNSYPVSYNTMSTVSPNPGEYSCQPPVHMVPAYYPPGQHGIQGPPVMYRVPTPPNTPTSSQMPSVPVMYMNSTTYPPAMMTTANFGHQVGPNGASGTSNGFVTPGLVPNVVFRQNVPLVTGVRASTPGSSQRASRSPTPAHDFFGGGNGDRNAQAPSRYSLPMYQGVHIMQGDIRFMYPGMSGNPRLHYPSVASPPVVQGCPRPYRGPPNISSSGINSYDGRNTKFRKPRSKLNNGLPAPRQNIYQSSPSTSTANSCNPQKNISEEKPAEDNAM